MLVRHRRNKRNRRRAGRKWVAPHLLEREEQGAFVTLIPGLRESEKEIYRNFTRMPSSVFDWFVVACPDKSDHYQATHSVSFANITSRTACDNIAVFGHG